MRRCLDHGLLRYGRTRSVRVETVTHMPGTMAWACIVRVTPQAVRRGRVGRKVYKIQG